MNLLDKANLLLGSVGRLINLVTFDTLNLQESQVRQSADPLMIILEYKLISKIDPQFHTELRKCIKSTVKNNGAFPGAIDLEGLSIKVYYKRRFDPAWSPDDDDDDDDDDSNLS